MMNVIVDVILPYLQVQILKYGHIIRITALIYIF